jgi:hypothetical protein
MLRRFYLSSLLSKYAPPSINRVSTSSSLFSRLTTSRDDDALASTFSCCVSPASALHHITIAQGSTSPKTLNSCRKGPKKSSPQGSASLRSPKKRAPVSSSRELEGTPPKEPKERIERVLSYVLALHGKEAKQDNISKPIWISELFDSNNSEHAREINLKRLHDKLLIKEYFDKGAFCKKAAVAIREREKQEKPWNIDSFDEWLNKSLQKSFRSDVESELLLNAGNEITKQNTGGGVEALVSPADVTNACKLILGTLLYLVQSAYDYTDTPQKLQTFADKYYDRKSNSSNFKKISSAFARCLSPIQIGAGTRLEWRNVSFQQLYDRLRKHKTIESYWLKVEDFAKVLILSGSSGCGKTIGALVIATENEENVVLYMNATHDGKFVDPTHLLKTSYCSEQEQTRVEDQYKMARNKAAVDFVMECVEKIVGTNPNFVAPDPSEDWQVFIVVDEIGSKPSLLRGLIASSDDVLMKVHNLLFQRNSTSRISSFKDSRVRIIAAGTGASYQTDVAASDPSRYTTFVFETAQRQGELNHFQHLVKTHVFGTAVDRKIIEDNDNIDVVEQVDPRSADEQRQIRGKLLRVDQTHQKVIREALRIRYELSETEKKLIASLDDSASTIPLQQSDLEHLQQHEEQLMRQFALFLQQSGLLSEQTTFTMEQIKAQYNTFKNEEWITPLEIEASHLVTNARCAALLVKYASDITKRLGKFPPWWTSVAAFNDMLRHGISFVVRGYVLRNGLFHEDQPEERLKEALTLALFPVPFLPDGLYNSLVTVGGVLVDLITTVDAAKQNKDIAAYLKPKSVEKKKDVIKTIVASNNSSAAPVKVLATYLDVANNGHCRFHLAPAHIAIARSLCGLSMGRSPDFSYSFEQNVADFCALTVMCSAAYARLFGQYFSTPEHSELLAAFKDKFVAEYDPLQSLKQLLVSFGNSVDGVKMLQPIDSPLRDWYALVRDLKDGETQQSLDLKKSELSVHFPAKCKLLLEDIKASLARRQAVVIISREMESFADVILVGPKKVLLFQCKQKISDKYDLDITNYDAELFKMACLEFGKVSEKSKKYSGWSYPNKQDQQKEMHKHRFGYLQTLKEAAACGGDVSAVEVYAIFMIEGPKDSEKVFKDKFKKNFNLPLDDDSSCTTKTIAKTDFFHSATVHHFVAHRSDIVAEKNKKPAGLSSFFPIPQTSELLSNCGKTIIVGEHVSRNLRK